MQGQLQAWMEANQFLAPAPAGSGAGNCLPGHKKASPMEVTRPKAERPHLKQQEVGQEQSMRSNRSRPWPDRVRQPRRSKRVSWGTPFLLACFAHLASAFSGGNDMVSVEAALYPSGGTCCDGRQRVNKGQDEEQVHCRCEGALSGPQGEQLWGWPGALVWATF